MVEEIIPYLYHLSQQHLPLGLYMCVLHVQPCTLYALHTYIFVQ